MTDSLLKITCRSRPRSRIAATTAESCGRQVAITVRPATKGILLASSSAINRASGGSQRSFSSRVYRTIKNAPVLDNYSIEHFKVGKDLAEVWQMPSRDQNQLPSGGTQPVERSSGFFIHNSVMGKGTVVVGRKQDEVHASLMPRGNPVVAVRKSEPRFRGHF